MEVILPIVFIIALVAFVYIINEKPKINPVTLTATKDLMGLQELAKLMILVDDTITLVANNHSEYHAKKLINKRIKKFQSQNKNYLYEAVVQCETNNKISIACCDASGNFNPAYAGNLGVIYNKIKTILQLSLQENLLEYSIISIIVDQYIYAEKNFNELVLLYEILSKPIYSYYLTNHHIDQVNSITYALDRLLSLYKENYKPDMAHLNSVKYGSSIINHHDVRTNDRQLQYLDYLVGL